MSSLNANKKGSRLLQKFHIPGRLKGVSPPLYIYSNSLSLNVTHLGIWDSEHILFLELCITRDIFQFRFKSNLTLRSRGVSIVTEGFASASTVPSGLLRAREIR